MKKLDLSEQLVYIGACIFTFGFWWLVKIVIKKAILETK